MAFDSTAVTHWIPAEKIDEMLGRAHYAGTVMLALMDTATVPPGSGPTVRLTRIAATTVNAGTKTEDAEFTLIDQASAEQSVSAGTVGATYRPTYEANFDSVHGVYQVAINNGVRALEVRVDSDACTLFSSLSNSANFTLTNLTDNKMLSAIAAFNLLNPNLTGITAAVLHAAQIRDWGQDLSASGAGYLGGDVESARVAQMLGVGVGFKGVRHGIAVFLDNNVPTGAGDASGAIFTAGSGGALSYRSWRVITVEQDVIPRRQSIELTVSARYGVAIRDNADAIKVVSRST